MEPVLMAFVTFVKNVLRMVLDALVLGFEKADADGKKIRNNVQFVECL